MTNTTNTNATNNTTLASRAAGLLSKAAAYSAAEKALQQALTARRVYPAMAQDFSEQLEVELPLKTRDFIRVVSHLLTASEKPLKGVISKRKSDILGVLAEIVGALTDTDVVALPAWALPKIKVKATEAEAEATEAEATKGSLAKANILAEAEANAEKAETEQVVKLAAAIALIVANADALTAYQRQLLASVLATEATEA